MLKETADCMILVVEDNPADLTLVREALKEHQIDCTLHVTNDGAKAIAFLSSLDTDSKAPRLDLVLLDMHLPKRDGADILKSLRATERYGQTPVIVMTASDAPEDYEKAEKNAALSYFRKPSSLAEFMKLGALVKSVLSGSNEQRIWGNEPKRVNGETKNAGAPK
ncbi:MAG TPA: response regulator [Bryobacteraceae bacterium]|nr:response regulator [Bryobacteraceae bacterium]